MNLTSFSQFCKYSAIYAFLLIYTNAPPSHGGTHTKEENATPVQRGTHTHSKEDDDYHNLEELAAHAWDTPTAEDTKSRAWFTEHICHLIVNSKHGKMPNEMHKLWNDMHTYCGGKKSETKLEQMKEELKGMIGTNWWNDEVEAMKTAIRAEANDEQFQSEMEEERKILTILKRGMPAENDGNVPEWFREGFGRVFLANGGFSVQNLVDALTMMLDKMLGEGNESLAFEVVEHYEKEHGHHGGQHFNHPRIGANRVKRSRGDGFFNLGIVIILLLIIFPPLGLGLLIASLLALLINSGQRRY